MDDRAPSLQDREFLDRLLSGRKEQDGIVASGRPPQIGIPQLAAWLERRLSDEESVDVELAMALDPELLSDMLAISREQNSLDQNSLATVSEKLLNDLVALGPANLQQTGTLLPFPSSRRSPFRRTAGTWLSWCAIAASVAVISFVGFDLGTFVGKQAISQTAASDVLQVPNDDLD